MGKIESEHIPNTAYLHRRLRKEHIKNDGGILPTAFGHGDSSEGLSVEWEKYATPDETRFRMTMSNWPLKNKMTKEKAKSFGVFKLKSKDVRKIINLKVEHTPSSRNNAHTSIIGIYELGKTDKLASRIKLANISKLIIEPFK